MVIFSLMIKAQFYHLDQENNKFMKKQALYELKQTLYPFYNELKSANMDSIQINRIQFFDVEPSRINWDYYISAKELNIRNFKNDIKLKKRENDFKTQVDIYKKLLSIFENDLLFHLFANKDISIQLPKDILLDVLENLHFFNGSNYILVGITTKKIISGDNNGFIHWEKVY